MGWTIVAQQTHCRIKQPGAGWTIFVHFILITEIQGMNLPRILVSL